jgi:CRISPR-associated endonuclease/helicase Cas3
MLRYAIDAPAGLVDAIEAAATFHDLGKLDPEIQSILHKGRGGSLPWDHVDAGVAHLSGANNWMAAWLTRAHHAPGLPEKQEHFNPDNLGRRLRGRRRDGDLAERHDEQIARTDGRLTDYVRLHEAAVGRQRISAQRPTHGLPMRLALSCLADTDYSDTASFDTGSVPTEPPAARWEARLRALCDYVGGLPPGEGRAEQERNRRRSEFFEACLAARIVEPMVACEGPVGIGKTTAVAAYLIRRAQEEGLRRLIVVAPYTNILRQTAERLRKAVVLPGEKPNEVIVEHHHRADFENWEDRHLAVLWRAPVVLTTAVSFFEALSGCNPASLRKLHELPGSAIFIDEAHAALPTKLWPQNWAWLRELAENWGCRVVLASGSLVRFWESPEVVRTPRRLPELTPSIQAESMQIAERRRVKYKRVKGGRVVGLDELMEAVSRAPGPRLLILNTVQSAAVVAQAMRKAGRDVLHLSTALTPRDRDRILERVVARLQKPEADWALVATSCVEAGVDLSFRTAFRERFAVSSIVQIGGRVNRHGELDAKGGGVVHDFALSGTGITQHPAAAVSADVLHETLTRGDLDHFSPSDVVTKAMGEELLRCGGLGADLLVKAEAERNYPKAAEFGRVIAADTRLVVVDSRLLRLLAAHRSVGFRRLLRGSVQLWARKIEKLGLEPLPGYREIFSWRARYEPEFLGCMAGILDNQKFLREGGAVV